MSDFRLLGWLRWRQWRSSIFYWLRTLGYDPQRQGFIDRLYALYLILFGLLWVTLLGAAAVHQAAEIGRLLPLRITQAFLGALPWIVVAGAIYLFVRSLRTSPVLLSFPDMAYVAASPLSRVAVVGVNFVQSCIQYWVVILPIAALLTVVIAQPLGEQVGRMAALRAAAAIAPLIPLLIGLAWTLGLLRLGRQGRSGTGWWWLGAFLLAPLAWLIAPLRSPGALISAAIAGDAVPPGLIVLWLLAILAAAALFRVARDVNLIAAAEESRTYARLNSLGLMAFLAPDVSLRIRRQEALARRKARFRLPSGNGLRALAARSGLLSLRRPWALGGLFLWGAATAASAAWLLLGQAPLLLWFFWITFLAIAPPKMLVQAFQSDVADPYLRQLLPASNAPLALAGSVVPALTLFLGMCAGSAAAARQFAVPTNGLLLMCTLAGAATLILLLSQGAAAARIGIFGWRPPYAAWLLIVVIIVGGAMLVLGPLTGAITGVTAGVAGLALALAASQPIPVE